MPTDAGAPDLDRQFRVVSLGTLVRFAKTGDHPLDVRRPEIDLAHLGGVAIPDLGVVVVSRHPACTARPGRRVLWRARARTEPEHERGLARVLLSGRCKLEAAGQHRVDGNPVALQIDEQELALSPDRLDALPDEGLQLSRRSAHGERSRSCHGPHRSTDKRRMERIGDDGQIGQFGHSVGIVAVGRRVLDSPGLKGRTAEER